MCQDATPQPLVGLHGDVCHAEEHNNLVRPQGGHQQQRVEFTVPHARDEDVAETRGDRVGDVGGKDPKRVQPRIDIRQCFAELVPFERLRSDALLVAADPFDVFEFLLPGQEPSHGRRIRQNEPEGHADHGGQETEDQKDDLPSSQRGVDISSDVSGDAVRKVPSEHLGEATHAEPDTDTERLFFFPVPLARKDLRRRRR